MKKSYLTALPVLMLLSAPVAADPAIGLGVTFTWGGTGSQGDTGIGLRVFSDDEKGEFVGSLGVDYMISSQRIRPNVGVAYLASKSYVGMDVGFDFASGGIDVGVGLGAASTRKKAAPVVIVLPPS
jgi:opacity protein-like surface antigen